MAGKALVCKTLINAGADIEHKTSASAGGMTPLTLAALSRDLKCLDALIKLKADVNAVNGNGDTALIQAVSQEKKKRKVRTPAKKQSTKTNEQYRKYRNPKKRVIKVDPNENNLVTIKHLIDAKASVDAQSSYGRTSLMIAAKRGNLARVQLLLDLGANHLKTCNGGTTAETYAEKAGHTNIADLLSKQNKGHAVYLAAISGDTELLEELTQNHTAVDEYRDGSGNTALTASASEGRIASMEILLKRGADINTCDEEGFTPLIWAARSGFAPGVKLLLEAGAAATLASNDGKTARAWAETKGFEEIVLMIDTYQTHKHGVRLYNASCEGDVEAVKAVIKEMEKENERKVEDVSTKSNRVIDGVVVNLKDEDVNTYRDADGLTSLMIASKNGHTELVQCLLNAGADVDIVSRDKCNAKTLAEQGGHTDVVALLDRQHSSNGKAVFLAACDGKTEDLKTLLAVCKDPDEYTREGNTALFIAMKNDHVDCVKLLLEANASLASKTGGDESMKSWATEKGYDSILPLVN